MLADIAAANAYGVLLVFSRLGAALMLLPGFGEGLVYPRARLGLALLLAIVLMPVVGPSLPPVPTTGFGAVFAIGSEVAIGLALGTLVRILASALQTAGQIIANQAGLATASIFDPMQGEQGAIVGRFLAMAGVAAIFASDLHLGMLRALADSYVVMAPGTMPPVADISETALAWIADTFTLAVELAAPLLVGGLGFFLGLGLVSRLMPQIQIFFVIMPLQIGLGLWLFMLALSATIFWFVDFFAARIGELTV